MFRSACYILVLLFYFAGPCFAQNKEQNFVNITQQDGLPSNETYCVFKDSKDYIWIATDRGVVRHKGSSMQLFNNLPDNVVFKIREDGKGRVWFFSRSGKLAYFFQERLYPFRFNDSIVKYVDKVLINDAYVADNDDIYLNSITAGRNFKVTHEGEIIKDHANIAMVNYCSTSQIYTSNIVINKARNNGILANIINPLITCKYNFLNIKRIDLAKPIEYNIPIPPVDIKQYGAVKLKDNSVVFWGDNQLVKLRSDNTYEVKEFPGRILSVCNDTINNVLVIGLLNAGIVWINDKLSIINTDRMKGHSVSSITIDNEGELWISTLENGIYYSKNSNNYKRFINTYTSQPAQRIITVADSFLLFANSNGIFQLINSKIAPVFREENHTVGDLQLSKEGDLYFVRDNNTTIERVIKKTPFSFINRIVLVYSNVEIVRLYNETCLVDYYDALAILSPFMRQPSTLLLPRYPVLSAIDKRITAIFPKDSNTVLWGSQKGLGTFNFKDSILTSFKDTAHILSKGITCIRQVSQNLYAAGITDGGVAILENNNFIGNITKENGLLDNTVKYLLPIGNRIWIATSQGVSLIQFSSYKPLKYTITNFSENAGLNNCIIYQMVAFKESILVATNKGIYQFNNIEELLKKNASAIPLYITTITTYKGDTSGINNIALPFSHNRLSVSFDAICYNTPKELKYNYRLLDGEDTSWQNLGGTQVILENLAPGQYELQVKASIPSQGRTSAIQTLSILILKPWWQLNWVRAAVVLLFLAIVFLVYKWRVGLIQQRESEKTLLKTQMAELEQTALRSQMNPHFIFNCLTSIQQLVLTGNRLEANEYLVKFSRLIRKTLELSAVPYTSIENEKNYLAEYIELEQLRMPGRFDFTFTIEEYIDVFKTELPNMMLQPIIENAIRHGVKHLQDRTGLINIEIAMQDDCLKCTVMDNGVGRREAGATNYFTPHKSYGMDIVRKRLTGLPGYDGKNYFIEIIDLVDEENNAAGTKVIVLLPFKTGHT